jgi:hypothetical protein
VGSTALSMTYGINVHLYNNPFIAIAEQAFEVSADSFIGTFLVDILSILKYVPDWFPGAKFQRKAAMMREHSVKIRNAPFAATKNLMVFIPSPFLWIVLLLMTTSFQANGDYDPSFVSEALRQIEHADNPNQDIDLSKDVAA